MDTYADDVAALVEALDLKDVIHVGHSTGGGEVARYIGRHGTKRVAMAVLIGAVPPLMMKTAANPGGLPIEVFDGIRAGSIADRSQLYGSRCRPVLRVQPARREGLPGLDRFILDARDDGWSQEYLVCIRHSPKRTSRRISRSSTCRLSSSMETTTRSCPSGILR